jgi:hypothetical protein
MALPHANKADVLGIWTMPPGTSREEFDERS